MRLVCNLTNDFSTSSSFYIILYLCMYIRKNHPKDVGIYYNKIYKTYYTYNINKMNPNIPSHSIRIILNSIKQNL